MSEICQKCKEEGSDRRTLSMACFYDMSELQIPFEKETIIEGGVNDAHPNSSHQFFTLRVCKDCRADWMTAIKTWWKMPPYKEINNPGTGIFVRELGTSVEVTEEEFFKRQKEASKNEKSS